LDESAAMLGAPRWRSLVEVDLPLLAPAIAAASAIVFLFTFTSFGVILLLGGPRHSTLEVEIYRQTAQLLDLQVAAALALVQLVAVVTLLLVTTRLQSRLAVQRRLRRRDEAADRVRTARQRLLLLTNFAVMAGLLGLPLLSLVERSFSVPGGHGLTWYRALASTGDTGLFVPPTEAIRNSLVFALIATLIATVIGGLASIAIGGRHTRLWLDVGLMLPLGVSAVTIGFGFLITLNRPPLDLRAKAILIPIAQALVALPFVVRSVVPVLRSIDDRLREAAAVLGASPSRTWREIDLPLVSRALAVGAGFAFAISLGEFGATVFVARPDTPTLPIAIFRLLGRPGAANYGQAMAMATILMVLTVACVLVFERARIGDLGDF
ncbi:MAG TPA: ABC transporter permease subunit, partial [Acidimicrobiales bacterium]|nr:ABC transporter permease subunit [Acidimicrobiales bacterium]